MNLNILNSSGGINYHLRAVLNKKRWRPFCDFVELWLREWVDRLGARKPNTLVLIGPNAGYTLPQSFLSRFQNLVLVESDPLAAALFQARFGLNVFSRTGLYSKAGLSMQWQPRDFFGLRQKTPQPETLRHLFATYPDAAFLFCNILGQIPVILREQRMGKKSQASQSSQTGADIENYMKKLGEILREEMKRHPVASYHDRFSCHLSRPNEMIDHLTGVLFSDAKDKKEFPWRITSREEHQIEFVRSDFLDH